MSLPLSLPFDGKRKRGGKGSSTHIRSSQTLYVGWLICKPSIRRSVTNRSIQPSVTLQYDQDYTTLCLLLSQSLNSLCISGLDTPTSLPWGTLRLESNRTIGRATHRPTLHVRCCDSLTHMIADADIRHRPLIITGWTVALTCRIFSSSQGGVHPRCHP